MTNKEKANLYFWPELGGKCKEGWVLHHKDPSWRKEDPVRYRQWNPEDLAPMTNEEHSKLHNSGENNPFFGKTLSDEIKQKISNSLKGKTRSDEIKQKLKMYHWFTNCIENRFCVECPRRRMDTWTFEK